MKKVLLIDDNPIDLLIHERVILSAFPDVEVIQSRSGPEALEYLKSSETPDYILLDIKMPLMDGFQFLNQFRIELEDMIHKVRIFMVSSSIDPDDLNRAKSDKCIANFFNKPLKAEDLLGQLV